MPVTRRGIYHNLKESKYTVSNSEIVFFFSSKYYLNKFMVGYADYRKKFYALHENTIKESHQNLSLLSDLNFYVEIETRGFRAWVKGVDLTWQEMEQFALQKLTDPNTLDWFVMQKPKLIERKKLME